MLNVPKTNNLFERARTNLHSLESRVSNSSSLSKRKTIIIRRKKGQVPSPMLITDENGNNHIRTEFEKTIEIETFNTTMKEGVNRD